MDWISVKDRFPPNDTEVLCFDGNYMRVMEYWQDDPITGIPKFFDGDRFTSITHWMPLPNPPKE